MFTANKYIYLLTDSFYPFHGAMIQNAIAKEHLTAMDVSTSVQETLNVCCHLGLYIKHNYRDFQMGHSSSSWVEGNLAYVNIKTNIVAGDR